MRYRRLYDPGGTYFFTLVTYQRAPIFNNPAAIRMLEKAIGSVQKRHPFTILAQVFLPDHIHAIWELPEGDNDYPMRWRLIKSKFSHSYQYHDGVEVSQSRRNKQERGIWQRRYWEHTIRDEVDLDNHIDYIHINPVHHGLVMLPGEWVYSTFSKYVQEGRYDPDWTMELWDKDWNTVRE